MGLKILKKLCIGIGFELLIVIKKSLSDDRIDVEPKWDDEINEDEIREWLEFRGKQPLIEEE